MAGAGGERYQLSCSPLAEDVMCGEGTWQTCRAVESLHFVLICVQTKHLRLVLNHTIMPPGWGLAYYYFTRLCLGGQTHFPELQLRAWSSFKEDGVHVLHHWCCPGARHGGVMALLGVVDIVRDLWRLRAPGSAGQILKIETHGRIFPARGRCSSSLILNLSLPFWSCIVYQPVCSLADEKDTFPWARVWAGTTLSSSGAPLEGLLCWWVQLSHTCLS